MGGSDGDGGCVQRSVALLVETDLVRRQHRFVRVRNDPTLQQEAVVSGRQVLTCTVVIEKELRIQSSLKILILSQFLCLGHCPKFKFLVAK